MIEASLKLAPRRENPMAGKGGGAWKVAYADFVTAMMAFFLVMWICGQDQKIRRSVSDYFSDPLGSADAATNKKPNRTGSTADFINSGTVPLEELVISGQGRKSFSSDRISTATKVVNDWLRLDKEASAYWHKQAKNQLEAARWSREVKEEKKSVEHTAIRQLVSQLHSEFRRDLPQKADGVYRDLLQLMIGDINWNELAEDLIGN
jgi:chemotaxis protein MotB